MSESNASDWIRPKEYDKHTHVYVVEVHFGAKISAMAKAEKKTKNTSGAATRRRDMS
jgi:hypothetical protein